VWRRLTAWLFRAGHYPDKGVNATRPLLDRLVTNLNSPSGAAPKLDLEHGPTEAVLDFGRVVPGSAAVVQGAPPGGQPGEWVVADVDIDPAVDDRLKTRGLSVLLNDQAGRIEKIAVTANPRVQGAQFTSDETWIPGGELMLKRFDAGEPGAPTEPELTEGFLGKLRTALGLGQGGEASAAAGMPPAGEPGADPAGFSDEAFLADPRTQALMARFTGQIQTLTQQVQTTQQQAEAANALATQQALAAFSTELKSRGVPPWLVDVLAPVALGAPKVKVAFSEGTGEAATVVFRDLDAAGAVRHALEQFAGAVPMARLLPVDDQREADPDAKAAALAQQIKAKNPAFSIFKCQELADQQLQAQVAMTGSK